jgi:hypothetical protein
VLLVAPDGSHIPLSVKLNFPTINNVAEYEACILGLEALLAIKVREMEVYGDSTLIIFQAQKIWKTKEEHLKLYQAYVEKLAQRFNKIEYTFIPQTQNQFSNSLVALASLVDIPENISDQPISIEQNSLPTHEEEIDTIDDDLHGGKLWFSDMQRFVEDGAYPERASKKDRRALRLAATQYIICGGVLYRRSYEGIHLRSVDETEAERLINEVHLGVCGPHMNGKMLARKILRMGFYWTTLEANCVDFVRKCHQCQVHANMNHIHLKELYNMMSLGFSQFGELT